MIFRKATFYEINELIRLSISLSNELSAGYVNENVPMTLEMVNRVYSNGGYYIVVQTEMGIIGWILIGIDQNFYNNETVGFIYELYIFPVYRQQGIGKKLMKKAVSEFKHAGIKKIQLNVFAKNPARTMYEKMGFKEVTSLMELPI